MRAALTIWQRAALIGALLPIAWGAVAVSWSQFIASRRPEAALVVRGDDARALANLANRKLVAPGAKRELASLRVLARNGVARDPTFAPAVRAVAIDQALGNDDTAAARMFELSGRVSKRDLLSRMWLIESRVSKGDVAGALKHYDIALRANPTSWPILFPILIAASADNGLVRPLAQLLATNPYWSVAFLPQFISQAPSQRNLLAIMTDSIQSGARPRLSAMHGLVARLGGAGAFDEAYRIYRLSGGKGGRTSLRDGNFAGQHLQPPIDWALSDNPDLVAVVEPRPDGDQALFFNAGTTTDIIAAQQLVAIEPGRYRLSATADLGESGARPYLTFRCATSTGAGVQIARVDVTGSSVSGILDIPAQGCRIQRLAIRTGVSGGTTGSRIWIDDIAIAPLSKGA